MIPARLRNFDWRLLSLEPALLIAFGARIWQTIAGLGTLFFIIRYFTPEIQGYYQTFLSLLALQSFLELGILVAIISVTSHEWSPLAFDETRSITGDEDALNRLSAAVRFVVVWFFGAAILLALFGGSVGAMILSQHGQSLVWFAPWIASIVLASMFLWCQGLIAVIEGCNQVRAVATYRFVQAIAGALMLWGAVAGGLALWSLPVMLGTNLICAVAFLGFVYRRPLLQLLRNRAPSTFRWRTDIWPMQWPLALQGATNYFMMALFVPVVFSYQGVVAAGQMGLSIQVVIAIASIASTWLTVKAPRMGTLYAGRAFDTFETTWRWASIISTGLAILGGMTVGSAVWIGNELGVSAMNRFLEPSTFTILIVWGIFLHVMNCVAAYWRAQRQEPVGFWGTIPGLATGSMIWLLGQHYGAMGAALAALGVSLLLTLPLGLFFLSRAISLQKQHRDAALRAPD